ncbi:MAG: carbamoyltransferase C-terminal domain-containing protein [Vicinamibacterales bacterium]
MVVLGIHDGHLATATLLVDGRISGMISEERLTRRKNQSGAPARSIGWLLRNAGLRGSDVDRVALATLTEPVGAWEDDLAQTRRRLFRAVTAAMPRAIAGSSRLVAPYVSFYGSRRDLSGVRQALVENGIDPSLCGTDRFDHHRCHAATACYLAPFPDPGSPVLVITTDGSGDGLCATVSIGREGRLERVQAIPSYHSIGEMYTRVTELLGMRPLDHEYKVMGLAPYAPPALAARAYEIFSTYFRLTPDRLAFENVSGTWGPGLHDRMSRDLRRIRFDAVAAGAQRLIEEVMTGFVLGWVEKTGIRQVAVAGGVFMNVKLNMLLSERPEIERLFLMPSCGDESISLGAAMLAHAGAEADGGRPVRFSPLGDLYLGPEYSREEVLAALAPLAGRVSWEECADIDAAVARKVADGDIVARMAGRMEWGARSLGNRAILADPRDLRNVRRINQAIKMRDFWMPFAPSILAERAADYLENPRNLDAPYMINAFRSTALAQRDLICGLHPVDFSCRPQIVTEKMNPRYHRLLREFERLTGVGGVLNTSFNLHGDPIVCSPTDALQTLLNSGLDAVAIEGFLVRKAQPGDAGRS